MKNKKARFFNVSFLALFTSFLLSTYSNATEIEGILRSCSSRDSHPELSECISNQASTSEAKLHKAERDFLNHLSRLNESSADISTAKQKFQDGMKAFQRYREKQCEFYKSMAMGGNGANDLYLACVSALNSDRSTEVSWATKYWK